MNEFETLDSVVEYQTGWYTGGYDLIAQPDGSEKRYYWADLPDAVVVVARHEDALVLVEQYRPVIDEHCLELPAGIVEDGESYEAAGKRELREETGFVSTELTLLDSFACSTGVLRHERGIIFADHLEAGERDLDDNEFLTVERVPLESALERARSDPANDATIEGLLLAEADGFL